MVTRELESDEHARALHVRKRGLELRIGRVAAIQRGGFEWTCNPYVGCTFGCSYCYAAFLPQNRRPVEDWGRWFTAKKNAVELARRQARKVAGQSVYLSSVTDPYQPIERRLELTRSVLQVLLDHGVQPRLTVQTRSPLVTRDIDLLRRFEHVRVNITIGTDSDEVRRRYEPHCPSIGRRFEAAAELAAAGRPSILIPLPTATDDHQRRNAEALVAQGAARMIQQQELTGERLAAEIVALAGDARGRSEMSARARALARPDAAKVIVDKVLELGRRTPSDRTRAATSDSRAGPCRLRVPPQN